MSKSIRSRQKLRFENLERRELLTVTPQLVGDLNLGSPNDQLQSDNAWLGEELFFAADDGNGDVELWKSNGTPDGTFRVKDIRVGTQGSLPRDFTSINGRILFTAYSDHNGRELWATDGTKYGTVLLQELAPGAASPALDSFTIVGEKIYFRTDEALWSTDGTATGTRHVTSISVVEDSLIPFGDRLLFRTHGPVGQLDLWVTNGTPDGTSLIPGGSHRDRIVVDSDAAFVESQDALWYTDGTNEGTIQIQEIDEAGIGSMAMIGESVFFTTGRSQLWYSDGTKEGTQLLKSFSSKRRIEKSILVGGELFFVVDSQLWKSDGTKEGTQFLKSFGFHRQIESQIVVGDELFFVVSRQLWKSDGTREGTQRVSSLNGRLHSLTAIGDRLYFNVGSRLWQSDGTAEGTTWVDGIENLNRWRKVNGDLYVVGSREDVGQELWRINSTENASRALEIVPGSASSTPWVMASQGEKTLIWSTEGDSRGLWATSEDAMQPLLLNDSIHGPSAGPMGGHPMIGHTPTFFELEGKPFMINGRTLWQIDGSNATRFEAAPPIGDSQIVVGDQLYFITDRDDDRLNELWRTDGSEEGTVRLTGIDDGVIDPRRLTESGDRLYFWAYGTDQRKKLWTFDDSQSKAVMIKDLQWPQRTSYSASMANLNGELYFSYRPTVDGNSELWKVHDSEGQAELVTVIPDIHGSLISAENQLFIVGSRVWRTDGTEGGTYFLTNEYPYTRNRHATVAGDRLFYLASSEETGEELWVSDGTVEGTHLVKDIVPGAQGCRLANMVAVDNTLFFSATNADGNRGLWKSDGTEDGTILVKETEAYPISSSDGVVYFHGSEPSTGSELWQSDGTQDGTVLVVDLNPGPDGSRQHRTNGAAAEINGRLYFAGDDGFHGYELWHVPLDRPTLPIPGDANRDGLFNSSDLVQVFQRGEYEDQIANNSIWEDGDWNGDGNFTTADLVFAFQSGTYHVAAVHAIQADAMSLIDWISNKDRKNEISFDPDSTDEIYDSLSV